MLETTLPFPHELLVKVERDLVMTEDQEGTGLVMNAAAPVRVDLPLKKMFMRTTVNCLIVEERTAP